MRRYSRIIKSLQRMLFLNPLRVALSLTGIAIGIAAVIIIISIGEGAKSSMLSQIEAMGGNVITVDAGLTKDIAGRTLQSKKVTTLKEKDAAAIEAECRAVSSVAPTQEKTMIVKYGSASTVARIIGTTSAYPGIRNFTLASGRFITTDDNERSARAVVIGQKCLAYLFPKTNPLGERIRINGIPFEIVGVLKGKGASFDGANEDDMTFIPLKTGLRRVYNVDYIKNVYVQAKSKEQIPLAEAEIRSMLRARHRLEDRNKQDDFTLQTAYTAARVGNDTDKFFSLLMTGVASLSLLVGGVGILATMLLSVKERKQEIGLRMAVGASTKDVVAQFLSEAILLSVAGGAAGIVAGTIGSCALGHFTDLAIRVSVQAVSVSFGISILIGIFFGSYPAKRASAIEPVRALKD